MWFHWFRAILLSVSLYVYVILTLHFFGLVPADFQICDIVPYSQQQACSSYSILIYLPVQIALGLDHHSWIADALATITIAIFTWKL
jgi:hypothetical protein